MHMSQNIKHIIASIFPPQRHMSDSSEGSGSEDDYEDSEDEHDLDLISRSTRYVKYGLYYVTDIERFQPPRKKPKLVTRTYRWVM